MKPVIALSLIFLSGCGILHIEIRDKTPKREVQKPQRSTEAPPKTYQPPAEALKIPFAGKRKGYAYR